MSYEFPPDTAIGGIATYVWHAARMLTRAGHHVEVVAASSKRSGTEVVDGVHVSRVLTPESGSTGFGRHAANVLAERNKAVDGFDVLESPEYRAEGAEFIATHPHVPLVVKLHTPTHLVAKLSAARFGWPQLARFWLGAMKRGQQPTWPSRSDTRMHDFERTFTRQADRVAAPSLAIGRIVGRDWGLPRDRIDTFPYPFAERADLAAIDLPNAQPGSRILFLGRLEPRKGVQHLGTALHYIQKHCPGATLRFVGSISNSPTAGESMDSYLRRKAGTSAKAMQFTGPQFQERLPTEFAAADVCVFPSLWENFPNVCLEAMMAGRAIVGSSAGGMSEMLADGAGSLVEPGSPRRWADAIVALLQDGDRRRVMGQLARAKVTRAYSYQAVLPAQIACYQAAVRFRRNQGPRPPHFIPPRPT